MDRRWEQRRAAASARWAENTSSVALGRADISGVQPTGAAEAPRIAHVPAAELLLEDMQRLELGDQSRSTRRAIYPAATVSSGPSWLRDTQRAMLTIAALSCSVLLALLYFGGFLG